MNGITKSLCYLAKAPVGLACGTGYYAAKAAKGATIIGGCLVTGILSIDSAVYLGKLDSVFHRTHPCNVINETVMNFIPGFIKPTQMFNLPTFANIGSRLVSMFGPKEHLSDVCAFSFKNRDKWFQNQVYLIPVALIGTIVLTKVFRGIEKCFNSGLKTLYSAPNQPSSQPQRPQSSSVATQTTETQQPASTRVILAKELQMINEFLAAKGIKDFDPKCLAFREEMCEDIVMELPNGENVQPIISSYSYGNIDFTVRSLGAGNPVSVYSKEG